MKKGIFVTLCLLTAGSLFSQPAPGPSRLARAFSQAGLPLLKQPVSPIDFSAPLLDGQTVTLAGLKGKVVFLNFWATWCGPCRAEMPSMEALYRRFKSRGLEILAVNLREDRKDAAAFMNQFKLTFPAALDSSGRIGSQYGVAAIPTTYIINREGMIIARMVGSIGWDTPEMIAAFEALMGS
jgi:thiol-disulfide isomerase/thioredoxin